MNDDFEKIINSADIQKQVSRVAAEISFYIRKNHIEVLDILWIADGAMFFAADVMRQISGKIRASSIKVSSYGDSLKSNKSPAFEADMSKYKGCDVLVIDDILDTGLTMSLIVECLLKSGVKSARSCVMFNKKIKNKKMENADFCGMPVEDKFILGYGLDFKGLYRNLPDVWAYLGK